MKKIMILWFMLTLAVFSLTACGGSSKSSSYDNAETMAAAYAVTSAETAAELYRETADMEMGSGSALGGSTEISTPQDTGRKLIRTVNLSVETDDFETLLKDLEAQIAALSGYVEQSDISGKSMNYDSSRRRASMTVRIPSTSLNSFISSVEANGNVTNKSETTSDVTLQYSDLESRKKSLTIEQDRIWALLEKADTLESVIALEERLSEIRYELESMESRLRLYDNQVEYSTVYINIQEVKIYTPTAPETFSERIQKGFIKNLENMEEFFVDLTILIISTIPIWVPIVIIVLIILFVLKKRKASKNIKNMISKLPVEFEQKTPDRDENK